MYSIASPPTDLRYIVTRADPLRTAVLRSTSGWFLYCTAVEKGLRIRNKGDKQVRMTERDEARENKKN